MDLKGITWVGNIYQKFEAMCLEVEDIMYQETAKYVENQVQNVGVSVKKFYAEVMQDLIPPSSVDPVKDEGSDLSLEQMADLGTYKKSKVAMQEDPIKENPPSHKVSDFGIYKKSKVSIEEDLIRKNPPIHKVSDAIGPAVKDSTLASFSSGVVIVNCLFPPSLDPVKAVGSNLCMEQKHAVDTYAKSKAGTDEDLHKQPSPPEVSEVIDPSGNDSSQASLFRGVLNKNNLLFPSSEDPVNGACSELSFQLKDNVGMYKNSRVIIEEDHIEERPHQPELSELIAPPGKGPNRASTLSGILSVESNGVDTSATRQLLSLTGSFRSGHEQCSEFAELEDFISLPELGRSDEDNSEMDEGNDAVELDMETIEELRNAKLGESCIVVDSKELGFILTRAGKHRSYKKKIRDAFALRMRSAKNQEYEELAISYKDIDGQDRAEHSTLSTLTRDLDPKKLEIHDFRDSEWELL